MSRPFVYIRKGAGMLAGRCRYVRLRLLPSEKELGGGAHHLRGPHWLEGKLGVDGLDALDGESLGLDLFLDQVSYRTHRARQAKAHVHMTPVVVYPNIVDQTQLHQVHPDLRVYDVPQLVPDALLGQHSLTSRRLLTTPPSSNYATLIVKPLPIFSTQVLSKEYARQRLVLVTHIPL